MEPEKYVSFVKKVTSGAQRGQYLRLLHRPLDGVTVASTTS